MPFDIENNTFLLAGPVKMHPRVLRAMSVPAMEHRAALFRERNLGIREDLQHVFGTTSDVVLMSGSGTLGMDAAAFCLLDKGDKAVAIGNGKFGNRFCTLADKYGDATLMQAGMGEDIPVDEIARTIAEVKPKVVFLTHNESSAGFTFPLKEIAAVAHEHDALVVADCITSVGGIPVPVDEWGVDIAIVGSQKCLGGPTGLVAMNVSERALERMYAGKGYYLDIPKWVKKFRDGDTPFTPAVPLHNAFSEALKVVREEGLDARFKRVAAQGAAVRAAAEAMGLELFVSDPARRSDTVTAIKYPEGVTDKDFRGTLKEKYGVVVAGGQDEAKGKIFRIGTLGTVSWPELGGAFNAIEKVFTELGAPIKRGAWSEAFLEQME